MSIRSLLETFDVSDIPSAKKPDDPLQVSLENARTSAFEAGYASGWEDAKVADDQSRGRVQAEFERNIEAISFTYHEAVDRVRGELTTFVDSLLSEFLPAILPEALRARIHTEILSAAEEQLNAPIEIVVSPNCLDLMTDLFQDDVTARIGLTEDANLAANQIFVRVAQKEVEINFAPLLSELKFQFEAIKNDNQEKLSHG